MQEYSSGFTSERLLLNEMKIVLTLRQEGKSESDIRQRVLEENLFQYRRQNSILTSLKLINRRVRLLDNRMQELFMTQGHRDRLAIVLYTFIRLYRLPHEFAQEVLRYHLLQYRKSLTEGDVIRFFEQKAEQSAVVDSWTVHTKKKLRQVMLQFFVECGMLDRSKGDSYWLIQPIAIGNELCSYVEKEARYVDFLPIILNR